MKLAVSHHPAYEGGATLPKKAGGAVADVLGSAGCETAIAGFLAKKSCGTRLASDDERKAD